MTFKIENELLNIPCPQCGNQIESKLTRVDENHEIICSTCGITFRYKPEQLSADNQVTNELINKLAADITAIGKKR